MRIWILFFLFLVGCDLSSNKETDSSTPKPQEVLTNPILSDSITSRLVEVKHFPYKDSVSDKAFNQSCKLTKANWLDFGYNAIEDFNNHFSYSSYGYFYVNEQLYILISRDYTEETIHWLCAVDENLHLVSHIMIAYDNSEGFYTCKATVDNKNSLTVLINSQEFDSEKQELYTFKQGNFRE